MKTNLFFLESLKLTSRQHLRSASDQCQEHFVLSSRVALVSFFLVFLPLVGYFCIFPLSTAFLSVLLIELLSCRFNPPPTLSLPFYFCFCPPSGASSLSYVPPHYLLSSNDPLKPCLLFAHFHLIITSFFPFIPLFIYMLLSP